VIEIKGYLELEFYDFIGVYILCYRQSVSTTQVSHIAAIVQQKSSAAYKQFTSYGGSNINQLD